MARGLQNDLDYYRRILGVGPDASPEELRSAWRALSKQVHPDHGGSETEFREVLEAYQMLSNPRARGANGADGPPTDPGGNYTPWSAVAEHSRRGWVPPRTLLQVFGIAMSLVVLVTILLAPAILAMGH